MLRDPRASQSLQLGVLLRVADVHAMAELRIVELVGYVAAVIHLGELARRQRRPCGARRALRRARRLARKARFGKDLLRVRCRLSPDRGASRQGENCRGDCYLWLQHKSPRIGLKTRYRLRLPACRSVTCALHLKPSYMVLQVSRLPRVTTAG